MLPQGDFYVQAAAWSQIVASVLFIVVLLWLWLKFIQPAILAAQENANKRIAEAERHRDEAKAALDRLHNGENTANEDARAIRERIAERAQREAEAAVAEAREAGERALENAAGEYDRAMTSARERLRIELLEKALNRARDEAVRRVDAAANERLVNAFVSSLDPSTSSGQGTNV